ncbi:hypothetical protein Tco_1436970 [Tanacetum coccineum]
MSQTENILESFKLIVKGKVFWARAKKHFVWSPSFKDIPEKELFSDDEYSKINEQSNNLNNDKEEESGALEESVHMNGEMAGSGEMCSSEVISSGESESEPYMRTKPPYPV